MKSPAIIAREGTAGRYLTWMRSPYRLGSAPSSR
ncbi:hypothetical protein J2T58_000959 [Methanocalculus alkaliphilus]|nr:hypothetical protein [Methanocalculus alkaliphilus]